MKSARKRIISLLLSAVLALTVIFAVPVFSSAVSKAGDLESTGLSFWADPENNLLQSDIDSFTSNQSKIKMTGAVGVYKRSTNSNYYYLFLPSNANCNNLKVWFTDSSVSVNGTELESGKTTDVFKDLDEGGIKKDYTLKIGSTSYNLVAVKSGDVGTVYIDTQSGSISSINGSSDHSVSESGSVMVVSPDGTVDYDGDMEKMQGRGNATWSTNSTKNPYGFKLAESTSLLGMGKAKKWVLLANAIDKNTLIKDQLTYDFAAYIGINYQPKCKPVDLYVNQQYYGSYQLAEKVEIKSTRVDVNDSYEALEIANGSVNSETGAITPADFKTMENFETRVYSASGSRLTSTSGANAYTHTVGARKYSGIANNSTFTNLKDPNDITGGYVFELEISERWGDEDTGFCAYNRQGWVVKSHDYVSKNMADYCYDLLYALGSSVYNGGTVPNTSTTTNCSSLSNLTIGVLGAKSITNPAPAEKYQGKRWSDLLDADSALRYYWTQELFKNLDSSTSSTYFYKDSDSVDSKLYSGPVWDLDHSIGYDEQGSYRWGESLGSPEGWYAKKTRIYRWRTSDSSTSYSSDSQAPLGFYAALATYCTDFDLMAKSEWYSNIAPAIDILLGNKTDPSGRLKSTAEYANIIQKSGTMNNMRHEINSSNPYDADSITSSINNWISSRRNWINNEFGTLSISTCKFESISDQTVTGKPIKPSVTITNNGVALKEGSDYSLTYSNNTSAGTARVTVTGEGYYSGSKTLDFTIKASSLIGASVSIRDSAYKGDTLIPQIINSEGNEINDFISYQWYADGVAIPSANEREYTISKNDQGKSITLKITGDGESLDAMTVTSNPCTVFEGEKPENYTETLAAWEYDYSVNSADIENADESGNSYYYAATSGQLAESAKLIGSVDSNNSAKIKWSGIGEEYKNGSASGKAQVPIMGTSKTDNLAWGEYPYFETVISTKHYENISYSAKLGGTKKGPRDWKLQYSINGADYYDVSSASYSLTANKDMQQAFSSVMLPETCADRETVYIRAVVCEDVAINGINAIIGELSGDAAINNVIITGTKTTAITALDSPVISSDSSFEDNRVIFDTNSVSISDTNGGADVYYCVNGEDYQLYNSSFNPFSDNAKAGDRATVFAYSMFGDILSPITELTFTYAGDNINRFEFDSYSQNVSNGAVFSNGGAFDKSAKMTAYTDGNSMYVPLWNAEKGAYSIAPDDGALWSEDSGFTFEVSTSGYKNICFSLKAFTTNLGPKSVFLQYSLNGSEWLNVVEYMDLRADGVLHQTFDRILLPAECNNRAKIYIRIATVENLTYLDEPLHHNLSKGNLYVNDIFISGDENGSIKMPYTNKTSDYFGSGTIKYYSADKKEMFYTVTDPDNNIILSGRYDAAGISIASAPNFSKFNSGAYKISIKAGDDDDSSQTNTRYYYYKGDKLSEFSFDGDDVLLEDHLDENNTLVSNSGGIYASSLTFRPNGGTPIALYYGDKYGIKSSYTAENPYAATKELDNPNGNGCYLIKTSTKGYKGITINAEQICSNKAPRDWGIAYSLNGVNFTFAPKSNARAISNDASDKTVETYNNFALPSECDDAETLYIKIFINGGESVDATELADVTKGNTGINNIEISGIAIPKQVDVTIRTYLQKSKAEVNFDCPVPASVVLDGEKASDETNTAVLSLTEGTTYTLYISVNETFIREVTFKAEENLVLDVGIVALDLNGDGIINAKDYSRIIRITNDSQNKAFEEAFKNFINVKSDGFEYSA